jgi:hypothetical protein
VSCLDYFLELGVVHELAGYPGDLVAGRDVLQLIVGVVSVAIEEPGI